MGLRRGNGTPEVNGVNGASNEEAMATDPPNNAQKKVRVSNYLVGKNLDDALNAGEDLEISWPFERGDVDDWVQAEAIWYSTLVPYFLRTPNLISQKETRPFRSPRTATETK